VVSAGEIWIYAGFFVTLVAAGLGFPAPEELVISGAGVLAGQLPPEPKTADVAVVYPTRAEVVGLLAVNPSAGSVGGLPWAALARSAADHELSAEEVAGLQAAGLISVNPSAGSVGGLPWAALGRAGPAVERRTYTPPDAIHVRWWVLLPVCILGVVISDIFLYGMGRWAGNWLLKQRWMARVLPPARRRRTEENFHRYGVSILVIGRLVPGIRMPLFLTAGSMRLPLLRFLIADGLGAVVGNSLFFFLGYWLGDSIKSLVGQAEARLKPILIVVAVGLLVAYLLWHFFRHPVSTGDPGEVPIIGHQVASHMHGDPAPDAHANSCADDGEEKKAADKKVAAPEDRPPP
jgi:membrane protein DedA with SNARE-associated domain